MCFLHFLKLILFFVEIRKFLNLASQIHIMVTRNTFVMNFKEKRNNLLQVTSLRSIYLIHLILNRV